MVNKNDIGKFIGIFVGVCIGSAFAHYATNRLFGGNNKLTN